MIIVSCRHTIALIAVSALPLVADDEGSTPARWVDSRSVIVREIKDHDLDGDTVRTASSGDPATCIEYLINPLGVPFEETHLRNGRRDGRSVTRDPDTGVTVLIQHFREGVKDGPFFGFYRSGAMRTAGQYRSGQLDGEFVSYFPNSFVSEVGQYVDGKKEGLWEVFAPNGDLRTVVQFRNGVEIGRKDLEPPVEPKPQVVSGNQKERHAQPGATDNPDDAQRLREDH